MFVINKKIFLILRNSLKQAFTAGGQFAFIEASRPRVMGDKAILQSPIFSTLSHVCFSMWYHMYGSRKLIFVPYHTIIIVPAIRKDIRKKQYWIIIVVYMTM